MEHDIATLDRQFGIAGVAKVVAGRGGLPAVRITAAEAVGEMVLHGGHVTSWVPAGDTEMLFVSADSRWEDGRAIRGGVPVCFPWFAAKAEDPNAPMHGFVRTKSWRLDSITQQGGAVAVSMVTSSDDTTRRWWPHEFRLLHRVTFGSQLRMELTLTNTGSTPLRFEEALHTYLRVGQIETARIHGLDQVRYLDKTDSNREKIQNGPIVIGSETDRVYLNTPGTVEVDDPTLGRKIRVAKQHSLATIVWNPWTEKARAMSDFGDDEWRQMICIETANVAAFAVDLAPGAEHTMTAILG